MLYAAKCYWPGVSQNELEQVGPRVAHAASKAALRQVAYAGALLFPNDELVLFLFEGPSRVAVKRATERARIPCERLMDSVWLGTGRRASGSDARGGNQNTTTNDLPFPIHHQQRGKHDPQAQQPSA